VTYTPRRPHGRPVQSDPYFTLMADADGVGFIHCGDAVVVIPLTDEGDALLAVEYSPAFGREILTLVSGSVEPGESLEEAANRELQEELGYRAGRLDFLGELHPFKYLTTRQFVFLARDLVPSKLAGDETHAITERRVVLNDFTGLCRTGELQDASAIATLCLARDYLTGLDRHEVQKGNASNEF
jgi:ADP-ribose diphosphatase